MAGFETEIIGGAMAALFGGVGWMFKGVAKKANDASALSKELNTRLSAVEDEMKIVRDVRVQVGKTDQKVDDVAKTLDRVAVYLMNDKKKS